MQFFQTSKRQFLSIDIGTDKIGVLLLEKTQTTPRLLEEWIEFRSSQMQQAEPEWWKEKLRQRVQEKRWKGKEVFLTSSQIPGLVRRFQIPLVKPTELKNVVHWQMKDHLPFPIETAIVEYRLLKRDKVVGGSKQLDLLAAAAPEAVVKKLVDNIEELSLHVKSVGLIPTALESGIRQTPYGQQTVAVLEIGTSSTCLILIEKGRIQFYRQLQVTGNTMTEALTGSIVTDSGRVDITPQQAENLKKKYGIPDRDLPPANVQEGVVLSKLAVMIRPALEKLTDEIKRTLDYYQMNFSQQGRGIEVLLLSGGASILKGLDQFLKEALGIPVSQLNLSPLLTNQPIPPEHVSRMNVAVGLALEHPNNFNLLPLSYRMKQLRRIEASFLRVVGVGLLALLVVIYLHQVWQLRSIQLQLEAQHSSVKNMQFILEISREMQQRDHLVSLIRQQQLLCPALMAHLSRSVPSNFLLESFSFDNGKKELLLEGVIYSRAEDSQKQLSDFIKQLQNFQWVSQVRLVTTSQIQEQNQNMERFEIICHLSN